MIRTISFTALAAAAVTVPAYAAEVTPAFDSAATAAMSASLAHEAAARQAQAALVRQGYSSVSELEKDANGRLIGTAVKDGKTVIVSIDARHPAPAGSSN